MREPGAQELPAQQHDLRLCLSGDVIRPGDLKCIPNEGMPVYRSPFQKGKLILQFEVS